MKRIILSFLAVATLMSCSKKEDVIANGNFTLNLNGLENLGINYVYEGWLMVNGSPISSGRFTVNDNGQQSKTSFTIPAANLNAATAFILTIEPSANDLPAPSDVHVLAGNFTGNNGLATVSHSAALGNDFTKISGKYILATPTDGGMMDNEESGVWFLDNSSGNPVKGLDLPTLPNGWKYEGWVVINGTPLSTGTFTNANAADANAATSTFKGSTNNGPAFPGEDFLRNAPAGLTFPTSLKGKTIVISIEPFPDNSAAPFVLKPLLNVVLADAKVHTTISMSSNLSSFPTGTFSR